MQRVDGGSSKFPGDSKGDDSRKLISTLTGKEYPFTRIREYADNGEPLEVYIPGIERARIKESPFIWERYADFLPFHGAEREFSLGEGNTPLLPAGKALQEYTGITELLLKNETLNPSWSFKDRGSLSCILLAREMEERVTATISTGNMGNSIAAYGAKAGLKVIVFVPGYTPVEKIRAMGIHGAEVIKVKAPDYSEMKSSVLELAGELGIRVVSGNGPVRVEGYKLTAFELFEQLEGDLPDYIAVPTSACGHIRGIFKGFRELKKAGYITELPRMIIVQAENNSPIVSAAKQGKEEIVPFTDFSTVAGAISSGRPPGGREIIRKARIFNWLAEDVQENEILAGQRRLAGSGYFVEPAAAVSLPAVKKLRQAGKIKAGERVVLILTGAGFKDFSVFQHQPYRLRESNLKDLRADLKMMLAGD